MSMSDGLVATFDNEMRITRSLLEVIPDADWDWRPHPKSTPLGELGNHIASLATFIPAVVQSDTFDLATATRPASSANSDALIKRFDDALPVCREALAACTDRDLTTIWSFRRGDELIFSAPRVAGLQVFVFSHMIHHRGQLSVYLRLRDVPLPSIYGPSADTPI